MSRHRAVKNLNLDEELDDGYDYEDEQDDYEDIAPEDKQSMDAGYEVIQKALKPTTSITPKEIKDALWEYYFNVDDSLKYLLDVESKREAAAGMSVARRGIAPQRGAVQQEAVSTVDRSLANLCIHDGPSEAKKSKLASKIAAKKAAAKRSTATDTVEPPPPVEARAPEPARGRRTNSYLFANRKPSEVHAKSPSEQNIEHVNALIKIDILDSVYRHSRTAFAEPSPDDIMFNSRKGTRLDPNDTPR